MTFASSFAAGLQLLEQQRLHENDNAIKKAGEDVAKEIAQEKAAKTEQERLAQQELAKNVQPTQAQEAPSMYQQGDSLGLQGYQPSNKPVEATVQTAPAGYGTREDGTAPDQTLLGNYGTAASFKGEKPTTEDTLRMQQDTTDQFQPRLFTGKNEQVTNVADLAANKPEAAPQEVAKPKPIDTLNDHVTAAMMAKDSYENNMRVLRKLEDSGNYKAALEYRKDFVNSELTLAQADHMKFTTAAAVAKQVGNMADNALELVKQPGADVNKIYYDTMTRAKEDLGFTGKIPFSIDPKENIRTLERFSKDSMLTSEKAELGIKQAVAQRDSIYKQTEVQFKEAELILKQAQENRAQGKENREQAQAQINTMAETIKAKQKIVDSLNSVQDKDLKKVYSDQINADMVILNKFTKDFSLKPAVSLVNTSKGVATTNTQPGTAPAAVSPNATTQSVNNAFPDDVLKDASVTSGAGGYVTPAPKAAAPAAKPAQEPQKQNTNAPKTEKEIQALAKDSLSPGESLVSVEPVTIGRGKKGYKITFKKQVSGRGGSSEYTDTKIISD